MKWQSKLTKKELRHLRESGITTLRQAKVNAEFQAKEMAKPGERSMLICSECTPINQKLGL